MLPGRYRSLATIDKQSTDFEAVTAFLLEVWQCHAEGTTFLGTLDRHGRWEDHVIGKARQENIRAVLENYSASRFNLYFCPNAFKGHRRLAVNALPTPYAWSDIDDADPYAFRPEPNILWETSPGRHQGLWIWNKSLPAIQAQQYSKNLFQTYGGDSGWTITKMLRIPGTVNLKRDYNRPMVRLLRYDTKSTRIPLSLAFTSMDNIVTSAADVDPEVYSAKDVLKKYRRDVGAIRHLVTAPKIVGRNRKSQVIFQVGAAFVKAGASDNEIASILWSCVYFVEKWGKDLVALEAEIGRIRAKVEAGQ